jgi:hypothetical protein
MWPALLPWPAPRRIASHRHTGPAGAPHRRALTARSPFRTVRPKTRRRRAPCSPPGVRRRRQQRCGPALRTAPDSQRFPGHAVHRLRAAAPASKPANCWCSAACPSRAHASPHQRRPGRAAPPQRGIRLPFGTIGRQQLKGSPTPNGRSTSTPRATPSTSRCPAYTQPAATPLVAAKAPQHRRPCAAGHLRRHPRSPDGARHRHLRPQVGRFALQSRRASGF